MNDIWIPRLYVLGQVVALGVCGVLLALGKDSVITDVFLAAAGSLLGTAGYTRLAQRTTGSTAPRDSA